MGMGSSELVAEISGFSLPRNARRRAATTGSIRRARS
jgi:hypothetical protein